MNCGRCGHSHECHGRRGFGSCSRRSATEYGRGEAERIVAYEESKGTDKTVVAVVIRTLLALPGMTVDCGCKRFRVTPAAAPSGQTKGGEK